MTSGKESKCWLPPSKSQTSVAVMVKQELLLPFIAMVFYAEFGSSLLQIFWFKLTRKRIFPIAPVHHWAQKANWQEPKIVTRFYIVAAMFALLGLSLLRL